MSTCIAQFHSVKNIGTASFKWMDNVIDFSEIHRWRHRSLSDVSPQVSKVSLVHNEHGWTRTEPCGTEQSKRTTCDDLLPRTTM